VSIPRRWRLRVRSPDGPGSRCGAAPRGHDPELVTRPQGACTPCASASQDRRRSRGPGPDDVQRREGVIVRAGLPCRRCRRESIGPFAGIGNQHEVAVNRARRDQSKAAPTVRDDDTSTRSAVSRRSGRASARTRPALNAVPAPVCDGSVFGAIRRCASRDPASLRSPRS
jgi:hypothetical protein